MSSPSDHEEPGSSPSPIALAEGTRLREEYRIVEVLGMGTFGITYRAHDEHLATDVAVKEYYPKHIATRGTETSRVRPQSPSTAEDFAYGRRQFIEESRTLARFDHPNVVDVRSFFEENGTGYLVMDYYEGQTLRNYVASHGGRLPEAEAVKLMWDVLDGLQTVHEAGILHRDIDPQNIYRTQEGTAILIDFGAARQPVGAEGQTLSILGKPGYAPIEQYRADGDQDVRTDLYACAATLYRCLTGLKPPPAPERVRGDPLEPVHRVRPSVSEAVSFAVQKGLALYSEQRPTSAQAFAELLGAPAVRDEAAPSSQTAAPPGEMQSPDSVPTQPLDDGQDGGAGSSREPPSGALPPAYVLLGLGLLVSLVGGLYFLPVDPLGSTSSSARLGPQSVAVLPFTYLASEDSTDYFSLGMTDELVTRLSKIEELSVTGRSSAMQYRGTDKPLPEIGKELGVAYVVGGRVQRVDRHVRIRVQLLRTHTGDVVWAGSFTRSFRNVLQLQADLARKAADELKARVLPSTQEQIRQAAPVDSAAYTLYLQARQLRFEQTPTSLATAARLLRQSVAIDSTFAPAWALLSYCAWTAPGSGLPTAVDPDSLARAAARRALALDSTSAEAHIAMGVVRELLDQNFPAAGPHLRRAVELNPSLANANREYGLYLTRMEQYEAAAPYLEKATRLNPVSPVAFLSLGVHDLYRGQYAQAVGPLQKAVSLQPNNALAHARLALAYAQLGRHNEALRHIRRAKAFEPGAAEHGYLGWAYAHMGRRDSARAVLSRLQTEFTDVPMAPPMRGALHAALGDLDRALDALTKTEAGSIMLRGFPLLDSLRTRPRFQGLLEERGLDDASVEKTMETLRKTPS